MITPDKREESVTPPDKLSHLTEQERRDVEFVQQQANFSSFRRVAEIADKAIAFAEQLSSARGEIADLKGNPPEDVDDLTRNAWRFCQRVGFAKTVKHFVTVLRWRKEWKERAEAAEAEIVDLKNRLNETGRLYSELLAADIKRARDISRLTEQRDSALEELAELRRLGSARQGEPQ